MKFEITTDKKICMTYAKSSIIVDLIIYKFYPTREKRINRKNISTRNF